MNRPKTNSQRIAKISTQQLFLTYSYDCMAMITSLVAFGFVLYNIYLSKILHLSTNQTALVVLIVLNFICLVASFLYKNKLQKLF